MVYVLLLADAIKMHSKTYLVDGTTVTKQVCGQGSQTCSVLFLHVAKIYGTFHVAFCTLKLLGGPLNSGKFSQCFSPFSEPGVSIIVTG